MFNKYSTKHVYKDTAHEISLTSIEVDTRSPQNFLGDGQFMAISCTPHTHEVRTAACAVPALTCKGTAEIFPCMTLGQILALGNLSDEQRYVLEMCIEAECHEEELDEDLKDSMFIVFSFLQAFWFRGSIISRPWSCMETLTNILRGRPEMASFYADEISFVRVITNPPSIQTQAQGQKGTANDSEGKDLHGDFGFNCAPMTADQVRDAYYSSEHENSLRDVYFEITLNMEADEPLSVELFQAFGPLIAVRFKNCVFTRTGRV